MFYPTNDYLITSSGSISIVEVPAISVILSMGHPGEGVVAVHDLTLENPYGFWSPYFVHIGALVKNKQLDLLILYLLLHFFLLFTKFTVFAIFMKIFGGSCRIGWTCSIIFPRAWGTRVVQSAGQESSW